MSQPAEELEPQTALIAVQDIDVPAIFGEGKVDKVLKYIRDQVADVVPDVSTAKGRSEIKSAAYKIARSKTLLDDAGKEYAADLKLKVAKIDQRRRKLRDDLDALKEEVRKPLTEWEEAEKQRAEEIAERINRFINAGQLTGTDSAAITAELAEVKAIEITEEGFGERKGEAAIAKDVAVSNLERALTSAKKREDEAAELERLRAEKEERDAREAEERRTREAEERARSEADRRAQERVEAAERRAQEAREDADRAQREAEEREQARLAEERRQREEEQRRAADREHRRKINSAAAAAIRAWSNVSEEQAQTVITLIAAGQVPAVSIKY